MKKKNIKATRSKASRGVALPLRGPLTAREKVVLRAAVNFAASKAAGKRGPEEAPVVGKFRRMVVPKSGKVSMTLPSRLQHVLEARKPSGIARPLTDAEQAREDRFSDRIAKQVAAERDLLRGNTVKYLLSRLDPAAGTTKKQATALRAASEKLHRPGLRGKEKDAASRQYLRAETPYIKALITWGVSCSLIADLFMREHLKWPEELRNRVIRRIGRKFNLLEEGHYRALAGRVMAPERKKVTKRYRGIYGRPETKFIAERIARLSLADARTALERLRAIKRRPREKAAAFKSRLDAAIPY